MALLLMDGFEGGDTLLKWSNASSAGSTTSTRFSYGKAVTMGNGSFYRSFPAASQVFVGVAMNSNLLDTVYRPYFILSGDSGATSHLTIGLTASAINLYRGAAGTLIASYSGVFTVGSWYFIEVSATIADTGGTCVVRLNGVTVINFTGDTKNAGTNTTIDTIYLGGNGGIAAGFDDLYICDSTGSAPHNTFLGDVRIYALSPSAAGSSTQFTPSAGANYTDVDELPYSATDYVTGGTVGFRDTYAMADLPTTAGTVYALQSNIIAKKTDAAIISLKSAIKSGASVYYGTPTSLGASDSVVIDRFTADPATSAQWTVSGVNAIEAGFEVA